MTRQSKFTATGRHRVPNVWGDMLFFVAAHTDIAPILTKEPKKFTPPPFLRCGGGTLTKSLHKLKTNTKKISIDF